MRCMKIQSNKRLHLNTKEDAEKVTMTATARINKKNSNSPQSCRECPALGHSTPVKQKDSLNNMEESPDLDYCPSPILLPCTQEGVNEVAWDWQGSLSKTPDTRSKKQNVQCETPKGTKILQRKRNSNSPLLYKPLKRKSIKMENIENIGQFAAELQALNERMRIIRQNNKNHLDDCVEENASTIIDTNNDKGIPRIEDNKQNCDKKSNGNNNAGRKSTSYDDLFDDSIDDSMARCTQEIEEKFNLIAAKGNLTVQLQTNITREESLCANNTADKASPVRLAFNEISRETSAKSLFREDTNDNNTLKTYSKLSLKRDADSSIHVPIWRNESLHKSCLNNNDMVYCHTEKMCDNRKSSKNNVIKLFDIPDDSFDDCLATCVEDEKLLSTPMESDASLTRRSNDTKFEAGCKRLTHTSLKGKLPCNSVVLESKSTTNSLKSAMKVETSTANLFENRKFFKTKSLSDQYFSENVITNVGNSASSASCYTARSTSHLNSLLKSSTISHTSASRVTRTSVSTNPIITNDRRKVEGSAVSLTRSAGRTHESDVNRTAAKEGGNRFVRYYSTGDMKHDTKETTKTGSQPARCTAEEIERKRLQAKMRLEARRKLYPMKVTNNINR